MADKNAKRLSRVCALVEVAGGSAGIDLTTKILFNSALNFQRVADFMTSDQPLAYKALGATLIASSAILAPLSTALISDGVTDLVRGTHHYLPLRILERLTKNAERKREINEYLEWTST